MDENTYGSDIVDQHWPYDGPHDDHTTAQAAAAIAHLVRYLANATSPGHRDSALPYAAAGYRVVSHMHSAVATLPQLLEQLGTFFDTQAGRDDLYDDRYDHEKYPAAQTALSASVAIEPAPAAAGRLAECLRRVAAQAGHLGNDEAAAARAKATGWTGITGEDLG